jgi:hypothetical protein
MPITQKDLNELPISFCGMDEVWLMVDAGGARYWNGCQIPFDGRTYKTGGTVTFKNGRSFRASFVVRTNTRNLIKRDSIYLSIGVNWFRIEEPALLAHLRLTREEIYPLTWRTDRPFAHRQQTPFVLSDDDDEAPLPRAVLLNQWLKRMVAQLLGWAE